METVGSVSSESERPDLDPEQLISLFKEVARTKAVSRQLFIEKNSIHGYGPNVVVGCAAQASAELSRADEEVALARIALSKIIANEWANRRIRVQMLNENYKRIEPTSHHAEYSAVSAVEGTITMVPGYETYDNILLIQAHPELPYYMTYVLNNQHEPLIAITLLDQEEA